MKIRWMVKYGTQVRFFDDVERARECYFYLLARGDKEVSVKEVPCMV